MGTVVAVVLFATWATCVAIFFVKPLVEKSFALQERRMQLQEEKVKPEPKGEALPLDLISEALSESEIWAREDRLKHLQDLYEKAGSWDGVRTVLGARE